MRRSGELWLFGRELGDRPTLSTGPDWEQAALPWIRGALHAALERPTGGWYVLDGSRNIGDGPNAFTINGRKLVVWRSDGRLVAGSENCPHMGANLCDGRLHDGKLLCPWHGLPIAAEGAKGYSPLKTFEDGALAWVQLPDEAVLTDSPVLPERPEHALEATVRRTARCEPSDVLANRLDPWHGVSFHPHSFARLKVLEQESDEITVRVVYRVLGKLGMEVDARFHCPDARTIVMTIVDGEGAGSVVETHATPLAEEQTAIVETTLATSDRPQFRNVVRWFGAPIRRAVCRRAERLWDDDAAYAERRYEMRTAGRGDTRRTDVAREQNG